jgi:hypothetical protein
MAALPPFNFAQLLADMSVEHRLPPPLFMPVLHRLPGRFACVCQFAGGDSLLSGSDLDARNSASCQLWLDMGHLITIDPRYNL